MTLQLFERERSMAQRWKRPLAFALLVALFGAALLLRRAPRPGPPTVRKTFNAMGTFVTIEAGGLDVEALREAVEAAASEVHRLEGLLSRFKPDSDVSRISRAAAGERLIVNDATVEVLLKAAEVSKLTRGAFDVTVGPLVRLWKESAEAGVVPGDDQISRMLGDVSWQALSIDSVDGAVRRHTDSVEIDLGGVAKGFIAGEAARLLVESGVAYGLVNAGGDGVFAGGGPQGGGWRIGITDPRDTSQIAETILVCDQAVVTSGNYQQFYEIEGRRYSHIIDPRTGRPAQGPASVTVIAADPAHADAWATALSVTGKEETILAAAEAAGIDFLMYFVEDGALKSIESPGFDGYRQACDEACLHKETHRHTRR